MKAPAQELISDLSDETREIISLVKKHLSPLSHEGFLLRPDEKSWSPAECLEHLNLYADHYYPVIQRKMNEAGPFKTDYQFKSGFTGNFFAKSLRPGKGMKLAAPSDKNPAKIGLQPKVLERFIRNQNTMLDLLKTARKRDLNGIKIPLSISTLIKFKLGDTFRFLIYHNQRHVLQAVKAMGNKSI